MKRALSLGLLAACVVGCGGAPPPTLMLSESQAAIRAAEEVGAPDAPKAALHLKMARDNVTLAEHRMREDENVEAGYFLGRAAADAELAIALAKAAKERQAVDETRSKIERLKNGQE